MEPQCIFLKLDIEKEVDQIPSADLILAFNIFPYIDNLDLFIKSIFVKINKVHLLYVNMMVRPYVLVQCQRMRDNKSKAI